MFDNHSNTGYDGCIPHKKINMNLRILEKCEVVLSAFIVDEITRIAQVDMMVLSAYTASTELLEPNSPVKKLRSLNFGLLTENYDDIEYLVSYFGKHQNNVIVASYKDETGMNCLLWGKPEDNRDITHTSCDTTQMMFLKMDSTEATSIAFYPQALRELTNQAQRTMQHISKSIGVNLLR